MSPATLLLLSALKFEHTVIQHIYVSAFRRYADFLAAADHVVKVPQMAESITEGTLKQFSKRMNTTLLLLT